MTIRDVDDVLDMIGFGRMQILVLLAWFCTTAYVQNEIVGFALLSFSIGCELRLSDTKLSLLASISYVGLLFSAQFAGYKVDSSGRRTIMIYSLLLAIIASIVSAFMPVFRLILFWSITGVFLSNLLYAMEGNKKSIRPFIANGVNYCNGLAGVLLSLWCFLLHPLSRVFLTIMNYRFQLWRCLILLNCVPGVIGLVAMAFLPESVQYMLSVGQNELAYDTLNKLYISNRKEDLKSIGVTGITPADHKQVDETNLFVAIWHSVIDLMSPPHVIPYIMATAIQCGYYFVGHGMSLRFTKLRYHIDAREDYICDLMVQSIDSNSTGTDFHCLNQRVNYTDNLVLGGTVVCVALVIQIALIWSTRRVIMFVAATMSAVCGFSLNMFIFYKIQLVVFVFFIVMANCCIALGTSVIIDMMPTHLRGKATSSTLALARAMVILSSFLIGAYMVSHCVITLNIYSFIMIVVAVIILFLPRRLQRVSFYVHGYSENPERTQSVLH